MNTAKAQVTQGLIKVLCEHAGYRVTRLGVEELLNEVKYLDPDQYAALKLPEQLRTMPDLLVADRELEHAYLVEVKFRRAFTDEASRALHAELVRQRAQWPESYAVVLCGEPIMPSGRFHQDYIRVVRPQATDSLVLHPALARCADRAAEFTAEMHGPERRWDCLGQIPDVFPLFRGSPILPSGMDRITETLRGLRDL